MLIGRDAALLDLHRAVDGGQSALLRGPRGSGRTALLDEFAAQQPGAIIRVRGNESVAGVPLAPFAPVLAEYGADLSDMLRIYTEFALTLAAEPALVVIDDLDRLDPASAVLVAQMHRAGARLVASSLGGTAMPERLQEITRRWTTVDVRPLEPADIAAIAGELLQAPLLPPSLARLVEVVEGLPAVLVAVLEDARAAGLLVTTPAGLRLDEPPVGDAALRVAGVDLGQEPGTAEAVEMLAASGDLPEGHLAPEVITALVRAGAVSADGEVVRLTDPRLRAWALGRLGPDERRRAMLRSLDRLPATAAWSERRSVLASCVHGVGDLPAAARWLMDHRRVGEAAHLLDRVLPGAGDPGELALLRVDIHLEQGALDEAVAALDEAEEHLGASDRIPLLVERWLTALGGRPDQENALRERVTRILDRVEEPSVRNVVLAAWHRRQAIAGFRGRSAPVEPAHHDPVVVALRESMTGSLTVAREVAAPSAAGQEGDDVDLDEQFRVLAHFLSLVYDGRLVEGREIAERHHQIARDQARPTLGLWTYNLAKIAFHAGQYDESAARAAEARRHLAWRDVAGQAVPADAMYAAALARLGRLEAAQRAAAALTAADRTLPRVRIGVARVESEVLRRSGRTDEAAEVLAAAGEYAVTHDEAHSGLLVVDEAFMVRPDPAVADLLVSLREKSALVAAFADRAVAVRAGDPEALLEVAGRFEAMIQPGRAAHAWSAAATLLESRRSPEPARRARQNAVRVSTRWQVTPWPSARPEESVLTSREYEIAVRGARRQRSREIAQELGLSVRTVDNHLARAYRKLGIAGRDELVDALALTD